MSLSTDAGSVTMADEDAGPGTDPCGAAAAIGGGISVLFSFDDAAQVAQWSAVPACPNGPGGACADTSVSDASSLSFDPSVGDPQPAGDPGSMEIQVPFSAYSQYAAFQHVFSCPVDLSGRTLFLRLRFDSGLSASPSDPGGFVLAVRTAPQGTYGSAAYTNLPLADTGWMEIDLPLSAPPFVGPSAATPYDPTEITAIQIQFDTGAGPLAGAPLPQPIPAIFHIDTVGFL